MAGPVHEQWSSRLAFIFAAVGSAVGLGNIWRFPYVAGENGGGAFVLIYIAAVFLIGWPVLVAELSVGRRGQKNPVGSILHVASESGATSRWKWLGYIGVFGGGLMLLSYYSVIAGWVLAYIIKAAMGTFEAISAGAATGIINEHFASTPIMIMWHLIFIAATIYIVARGINAGLEKAVTYLMPALFLLLLVLVGYSMATADFAQALNYLFAPDFSKVTGGTVLAALGQALFSLSVAVGTMFAYGSYLPKDVSLPQSAGLVAASDTGVALIAGLAIFPLVFAYGLEPTSGPSLIFETLPIAFGQMTGGAIFGTLFFILLAIAAVTSSISLLEPAVAFLEERMNWSRWLAAVFAGGGAFVVGLLSVFSYNEWQDLLPLAFIGITEVGGNAATFYTLIDFLVSNIVMPVGALMLAIFAGWSVKRAIMQDELDLPEGGLFEIWHVLIKFVAPIVLILILISGLT